MVDYWLLWLIIGCCGWVSVVVVVVLSYSNQNICNAPLSPTLKGAQRVVVIVSTHLKSCRWLA